MRNEREIQRAHDLLIGILLKECCTPDVPESPISPEQQTHASAAVDVLCWTLEHEHNTTFASNLCALEDWLNVHGLVLREYNATATSRNLPPQRSAKTAGDDDKAHSQSVSALTDKISAVLLPPEEGYPPPGLQQKFQVDSLIGEFLKYCMEVCNYATGH